MGKRVRDVTVRGQSFIDNGLSTRFVTHVPQSKAYYQAFFWVMIDLIVELLGLIIKPFDNQTER